MRGRSYTALSPLLYADIDIRQDPLTTPTSSRQGDAVDGFRVAVDLPLLPQEPLTREAS
jgi:hypothetical protein